MHVSCITQIIILLVSIFLTPLVFALPELELYSKTCIAITVEWTRENELVTMCKQLDWMNDKIQTESKWNNTFKRRKCKTQFTWTNANGSVFLIICLCRIEYAFHFVCVVNWPINVYLHNSLPTITKSIWQPNIGKWYETTTLTHFIHVHHAGEWLIADLFYQKGDKKSHEFAIGKCGWLLCASWNVSRGLLFGKINSNVATGAIYIIQMYSFFLLVASCAFLLFAWK